MEDIAAAFEPDMIKLEDTVLDVPNAYHIMATLLHGAGLPMDVIEDLGGRIVVRRNVCRDRLLEELRACDAVPEYSDMHAHTRHTSCASDSLSGEDIEGSLVARS